LCGVVMVIWLMSTARVTWIISVVQVFTFIGFVSVIKAKRVIVTLNEYAKNCEELSECQGR
jgi:ABC-type microcin C transport system permease subunit YejE